MNSKFNMQNVRQHHAKCAPASQLCDYSRLGCRAADIVARMSAAICGNTTPDVASLIKSVSTFRSFSGFIKATHVDRSAAPRPSSRSRMPERAAQPQRSRSPAAPIPCKGRWDHKPVTDPCALCRRSASLLQIVLTARRVALVVLSCIQFSFFRIFGRM
jgi:hypothetical protein